MILLFLKSYFREIAFVVILSMAVLAVYNKGYSEGYQNRVSFYEESRKQDFLALDTKIDNIESLATTLSIQVQYGQTGLSKDLNNLTADVKNKNFTVLKNGECIPSEDFINTFNAVINRGNQK